MPDSSLPPIAAAPLDARGLKIPSRRLKLAAVVFLFIAVVAVSMPRLLIPLGFAGGSVDGDWFTLGVNLATVGVLGDKEEPLVYRAPGFPAFIALVLKLTVDPDRHTPEIVNGIGPTAVLFAQAFLLGLSTVLLHAWLSRRLSPVSAFAAALLFGTNAYSLVLAGLVHYDLLHWALLIAFILVLEVALESEGRNGPATSFFAGLVLGAWVLTRPTALLVPLSVLPLFIAGKRGRSGLRSYAALILGFLILLLPWTARNFAVTGRLLPVHAQGWTAMFASTCEPLLRNPDVYEWNSVGLRDYLPLYTRVTGEKEIAISTYSRQVIRLEDAAREAAISNLKEKPHVYAVNFVTAVAGLTTRVNAVLLTLFTKMQTGSEFDVRWIAGGHRRNMMRGPEAHAFQLLHDLLLIAALFGLVRGGLRRDAFLAVPVVLFGTILLAHALSYLDFYYYAVKIPFLVAFAFYGIELLPGAFRVGLTVAFSGFSLALTWAMGFFAF